MFDLIGDSVERCEDYVFDWQGYAIPLAPSSRITSGEFDRPKNKFLKLGLDLFSCGPIDEAILSPPMLRPNSEHNCFLPDGENRLLEGIRQSLKETLTKIATCGLSEAQKQAATVEAEKEAAELEKRLVNSLNHF